METTELPRREDVAGIRLAVSCEAIIQQHDRSEDPEDDDSAEAMTDLRHYFQPIRDALKDAETDLVSIGDEAEPSEYDGELEVVAGSFHGDVTLEQWDAIASGYGIDLAEGSVLPEKFDPTMGILDGCGITPAVSIPYTDEGWGCFMREPALIASFYVAVALKSPEGS